jgi:hypothetical protein
VRGKFEFIAAWSVDRLRRSLKDLLGFLTEIHALEVGVYLHQQAVDTTTPAGKALFQMMGVFAETRVKANSGQAAEFQSLFPPLGPAALCQWPEPRQDASLLTTQCYFCRIRRCADQQENLSGVLQSSSRRRGPS